MATKKRKGIGLDTPPVVIHGEDPDGDPRALAVDEDGHARTFAPAKTSTTAIGATLKDILPATKVTGVGSYTLWLKNTGTNPLTDCNVLLSPDGATWTPDVSAGKFDTLASGAMDSYTPTTRAAYIKVQAAAAAAPNTTTSDAWLVGTHG